MTDTSPLPLSPLTLTELVDRSTAARDECGGRVIAVHRAGGEFRPADFEYLEARAAEYDQYTWASSVRLIAVRKPGSN